MNLNIFHNVKKYFTNFFYNYINFEERKKNEMFKHI
jgi:hypothetical protein